MRRSRRWRRRSANVVVMELVGERAVSEGPYSTRRAHITRRLASQGSTRGSSERKERRWKSIRQMEKFRSPMRGRKGSDSPPSAAVTKNQRNSQVNKSQAKQ